MSSPSRAKTMRAVKFSVLPVSQNLVGVGGKKSQRLVHRDVIKVRQENKNVYCENCNRKFFSRQAFNCPAGPAVLCKFS